MSKWWLQVMRDEFVPRERREHTGEGGGPIETKNVGITNDQQVRAAATLLDALAAQYSAADARGECAMGAAEQSTMGGDTQPG